MSNILLLFVLGWSLATIAKVIYKYFKFPSYNFYSAVVDFAFSIFVGVIAGIIYIAIYNSAARAIENNDLEHLRQAIEMLRQHS